MIIKKILVPFIGRYEPELAEQLDESALKMALLVASQYNAHVQALFVKENSQKPEERISAWLPGSSVNELINWIKKEGKERRKHAMSTFSKTVEIFDPKPQITDELTPSFSASYTEQIGDIGATVGQLGRASDLVVITNSKARWNMQFKPLLEASLHLTGRPVLVCQVDIPSTFAKRIAIAWNDSNEAARAIGNALHILKNAEYVALISCQENDNKEIDSKNILDYLKLHNIDAEFISLFETSRRSAEKIIHTAESKQCDLLVMGTYFHARPHSLVFGSLTEYVLSEPNLTVLLSP